MGNYRNQVRPKDNFGGTYEDLNLGDTSITMSGEPKVYIITEDGFNYLGELFGIDNKRDINDMISKSRLTLEEFFKKNSMKEWEHYISGPHAMFRLEEERKAKEKETSQVKN